MESKECFELAKTSYLGSDQYRWVILWLVLENSASRCSKRTVPWTMDRTVQKVDPNCSSKLVHLIFFYSFNFILPPRIFFVVRISVRSLIRHSLTIQVRPNTHAIAHVFYYCPILVSNNSSSN